MKLQNSSFYLQKALKTAVEKLLTVKNGRESREVMETEILSRLRICTPEPLTKTDRQE